MWCIINGIDAGHEPPRHVTAVAAKADILVLLGSLWADLEHRTTRWREIVRRWSDDPDVHRVTVVDFPAFRRSAILRPASIVEDATSWLGGVRAISATIPAGLRPASYDGLAWRLAGRAIARAWDRSNGPAVAVATNPLWVPMLRYVDATCRAFDAYDDWRHLPAVADLRLRVERGYDAALSADVVTTNSTVLAARLKEHPGVDAVVVRNGVDVERFGGTSPSPDALPEGPFAVYVGTIEGRVDLDLLELVARKLGNRMQMVIAGPTDPATAARLERSDLHWIGPVPTDLVPGLLARARVAVIPHLVNALTESMDPMKLLEYLAAGLPVVTTSLPDLGLGSSRLTVATTADEFADAILAASRLPRPTEADTRLVGRDWRSVSRRLLDAYLGAG